MIGNDIIDFTLFLKETNWKRPNFLNKIYTVKEQEQILNAPDPPVLIAIFWAMKEATYKAHHRKFSLPRKYNPSNYECSLSEKEVNGIISGDIKILDNKYAAEIWKSETFIHCTAKASEVKIFQKIYKEEVDIKSEIITHYSDFKPLNPLDFSIRKDENYIPQIFHLEEELNVPFSISHDGAYSAFILALTNS